MRVENLAKGNLYSNMNGVYKFVSNGILGNKKVSCFWLCEYDDEKEKYVEMTTPVFMEEDEVLTLDRA